MLSWVLAAPLLLPLYGFLAGDNAVVPRLAVGAFFCLAVFRPVDGLLVCAGLLTLSGSIGPVLGFAFDPAEALLLAFLAGWLVHNAIRPGPTDDDERGAVLTPALLLAGVVAAWGLVQFFVAQAVVDYPWPFLRQVLAFFAGDYLRAPNIYTDMPTVTPMLEGIGLFVAMIRLSRRDPALPRRAAAMMVVGGGAVATLNLVRLAQFCLSSDAPARAFVFSLHGLRVSAVFGDFNAAGSYLALVLLLAVGLAVVSRRFRAAWLTTAGATAIALWLTGSRAALLACALGFGFLLVRLARVRRALTIRYGAVAVAVVALVVLAIAWGIPADSRIRPLAGSVYGRLEMGKVAARMVADYPIFGVGPGQFWGRSGRYMTPDFRALMGHENAHNNFLQVLAELGLVGFVPFVWVLAAVGWRAWRARHTTSDPLRLAAVAGMLVFVSTWLVSHPLLVRVVCDAYWLALGVIATWSFDAAPRSPGIRSRGTRWRNAVVAIGFAGLGVSVPLRAERFLATEMELENIGIGFSKWQSGEDVLKFRTLKGRASFYVPTTSCGVFVPVRLEDGGRLEEVDLELLVDGRLANGAHAVRGQWRELGVLLPRGSRARFYTVELRTPDTTAAVVQTAKPRLLPCLR